MKRILLIVDPQNDFITGTLSVPEAGEKMRCLSKYLNMWGRLYDFVCVTLDSHPEDHSSFVENGGIWPKHCVSYTEGWELPEHLNEALNNLNNDRTSPIAVHYYHKGTEKEKEEYSLFDNTEDGAVFYNQIRNLLKEDFVDIDVCGIAGDYCVLETIKGLRKVIGDDCINVLLPLTASIDGGEKLIKYLKDNEIKSVVETINI